MEDLFMKLNMKTFLGLLLPSVLIASESTDHSPLFEKNFFEASLETERNQIRDMLNPSNINSFLENQSQLALSLNSDNFRQDPRIEWIISSYERSYNPGDFCENYNNLKDLIDTDGIRKLGYANIENLENGLFGSQTEEKIQQAYSKTEREGKRVGKQIENVGKKIGDKLGL